MNAFTASRPAAVASHVAFATIAIMDGRRPFTAALDGLCLAIARGDGGASAILARASVHGLLA